jgi:hypothetical protein
MTRSTRALIACRVGILALLALDLTSQPALAADVVVKGSYHTTKKEGDFTDYNAETAEVTASYTVATKVVDGRKVFDYANSFVIFKHKFGNIDFETVKIPITEAAGNPDTGAVTSFKFSGTNWDPDYPSDGEQDVKNDGISGEVNVTNKTANITSKYKDSDSKVAHYTFATEDEKPGKPQSNPGTGKPIKVDTSISPSESIDFDAASGTLSITDDIIVGTPDPSDPILGANVTFSDYLFTGFTTDGTLAIFWPLSGTGAITVSKGSDIFERAELPVLFYDSAEDLFYGTLFGYTFAGMSPSSPFYDPTLSTIQSPHLNSLASMLDPSSPFYDASSRLYWTISPDGNLAALTNGFTTSFSVGGSDLEFLAVPEPTAVAMLLVGLAGVGALRVRSRRPGRYKTGER